MRYLIFISTRKKKVFFHAHGKYRAFLRAPEPNAIVPRSKYIILTKTYEPGWGGGGRANLIIHTPGNLFFFAFMVILSSLQLQILVLLLSLAKSA